MADRLFNGGARSARSGCSQKIPERGPRWIQNLWQRYTRSNLADNIGQIVTLILRSAGETVMDEMGCSQNPSGDHLLLRIRG